MNIRWQTAVAELDAQHIPYVIVTIIGVEGSAPRDAGTKMVVSKEDIYGSIGGGNLEFICMQKARELLMENSNAQLIEYYPLSAKFNQCCSGAVSVMFESFVSQPLKVAIFGAGHVAKELSVLLPRMGCELTLIDQRQEQLHGVENSNVLLRHTNEPLDDLDQIDPSSYVLVMTHDHSLDFELCCKAISTFDFAFLGLIGSAAKAQKFKTRMSNLGFDQPSLDKLTSPIGLALVPGKKPMEIAVSVAAQILNLFYANSVLQDQPNGISLKDTLRVKTHMNK